MESTPELSPNIWNELFRIASSERRNFRNIPGGPENTHSLFSRAAVKFPEGGLPTFKSPEHLFAAWRKTLHDVLVDLWRHGRTAQGVGRKNEVPIEEHHLCTDPRDEEIVGHMIHALQKLARLDEEMGEQKARILTLRYLEGYKWRVIAAELESSITTVRREAEFAIAWMRDQLRRQGIPINGRV